MSYDFQYYSGDMLTLPEKPKRPKLGLAPSAEEARRYANELEVYDRDMEQYMITLQAYDKKKNRVD